MVWLFQSHTLQLCLTKSQLRNNTRGISDVSVTCKPYGSSVEISSPVDSSVTLRDPELTEWSHMCYCSPQCTAGRTLLLISNVFCMGDWNFCLSLLVPRKSLFLLCWDDMEYVSWPTRRDSRTTLWNHFSFSTPMLVREVKPRESSFHTKNLTCWAILLLPNVIFVVKKGT